MSEENVKTARDEAEALNRGLMEPQRMPSRMRNCRS